MLPGQVDAPRGEFAPPTLRLGEELVEENEGGITEGRIRPSYIAAPSKPVKVLPFSAAAPRGEFAPPTLRHCY